MKKYPFLWGIFSLMMVSLLFYSLSKSISGLIDRDEGGEKIAVVAVEGVITGSDDVVKKLKKYGNDSSIKGVLIRINSPGGGVAPSQEIYSEIVRLRNEKGKKVVASMGSLGASGGYYIACAADKIMANPGTITGSIGVLMPLSNIEGLMGKIGLKASVVKSGKFKDITSPTHKITEEEMKLLQGAVDDVHDQFIEAVAGGRGMDKERVRELADGRIYTGRQALKAGLIDALGGYEDALLMLAELAGMEGEPKVVREKEDKGFLYKLIRGETASLFKQSVFTRFPGFQYLLDW